MSFDVLQDKIKAKKNPTVAGLDARVEHVPPSILKKHMDRHGQTLEAAADVRYAFDELGRGAVVNASRSIMCAWQKTGKDGADYQEAARAAAEQMRDEIRQYVQIL